jgi:hypothetical protein
VGSGSAQVAASCPAGTTLKVAARRKLQENKKYTEKCHSLICFTAVIVSVNMLKFSEHLHCLSSAPINHMLPRAEGSANRKDLFHNCAQRFVDNYF